jgi:oligopeptide transport system ATP-binding protein
MTDAVLACEGLHKEYRVRGHGRLRRAGPDERRPALVDLSLALGRRQVLGLVGESGSGKSTLARCLNLLERPDAGRVLLHGVDLATLPSRELRRRRRRIQIVFQDPYASLNPRQSVHAALAEVLRVHRLVPRDRIDARVAELLSLVGLPASAAGRFPREFSGGQRQRICIARALAAEPDVLIADEPLSSLDVSIQAQILNLLLGLRDELGLAMLFISHDLHVVRRSAPTIAVMFSGRIVEVLPATVPLDAARHPYTRALLEALPRLDAKLPGVPRGGEGAPLEPGGCPFRDRCPYAFETCVEIDPPLLEIAPGHAVACHDVARSRKGTW